MTRAVPAGGVHMLELGEGVDEVLVMERGAVVPVSTEDIVCVCVCVCVCAFVGDDRLYAPRHESESVMGEVGEAIVGGSDPLAMDGCDEG